jgi:outer membrane protein insertion porin family
MGRLPNPPQSISGLFQVAGAALLAGFLCLSQATAQQNAAAFSYQGEPVAAVLLVASPTVDIRPLEHLVKLKSNQPYSKTAAEATAFALRSAGHFTRVDIQISLEADGLHVTFLLQPVYYIGTISFSGSTDDFDYARLLNVVDYPSDRPYEKSLANAGVRALQGFFSNEGYFLARVHEETKLDTVHKLANLVYHVTLGKRAKFGTIEVVGPPPLQAERILGALHSIRSLLKGGDIKPGKTYRPSDVQTASRMIRNYLGSQDWLASQITLPVPNYDPQTNRVPIRFHVKLGPKVKIHVAGARVHGKELKTLIPIYQDNVFSDYLVTEGSRNLFRYLQSKGYFDARVYPKVEKTRSLISLTYEVDRHRRHSVESISYTGNRHFDEDTLDPLVAIQTEHFLSRGQFSQSLLNQSVTNLTGFYQNAGFEHVRVSPTVKDVEPNLYVAFHIKEGPRTIVNHVTVVGLQRETLATVAPGGLRLRSGKPFSPANISFDRKRIVASYLNLGYPDVSLQATSTPVPDQPHHVNIRYIIGEGPHVTIRSVLILGERHAKPQFIRRNAGIHAGAPLSQGRMLAAESALYNLGIFDWASVAPPHSIAEANGLITEAQSPAALPLSAGPEIAALNQVDPLQDVLVKVHESKRNQISYGFGFLSTPATGQIATGVLQLPGLPTIGIPTNFKPQFQKTVISPELSLEYSRRDLGGRDETASVSTVLSSLDQRFTFSYDDPQFLGPGWSALLSASTERTTQNPMFTANLGQGALEFDRLLNSAGTERLELRYSYQATALSNLLVLHFIPPDDQSIRDSTLSASFIRDTRDNPMDAHRGVFETVDLDLTPRIIGSSDNFARFFGSFATYHQVKPWMVWANRVELGEEEAFAGSHVPFSDRFFTGGADSLRGFPINDAGPHLPALLCSKLNDLKSCTGQVLVPAGGPQLFIFNSEGRFPIPITIPVIKHLGGVVFYDGGNVFSSIGFNHFFRQYSNTVGFGLRYQTPVGPIRFDIGHNLSPPAGFNANQIFVTIGQAF